MSHKTISKPLDTRERLGRVGEKTILLYVKVVEIPNEYDAVMEADTPYTSRNQTARKRSRGKQRLLPGIR